MRKHRKIYEKFIKRKLKPSEHIHHIDCNPYNNNVDNLFLTDYKGHAKAHKSLRSIRRTVARYPYATISIEKAQELIKEGLIIFDNDLGIYMYIE